MNLKLQFLFGDFQLIDNCCCRVPRSNNSRTYIFTPHSVVRELFSSFNMEYKGLPPFNASAVVELNDTLPAGLNADDVAFGGRVPHIFLWLRLTSFKPSFTTTVLLIVLRARL